MGNKRENVLFLAEKLEKMMKDNDCNTSSIEQVEELKRDMEEDFFTILVVGEFKRGKTTFVNALIKEDLLISDVLPETATIQAVIHGEQKKAQVIFKDGTVINGKANKEFLKEYSAKNADVANSIRYIKISHSTEMLGEKVVLVDTPGVADLDEQRVQVTYDFLPKANAVIFLLDAVSPMKKSEKEFIEEQLIPRGISKIIFVINKMDIFDDEDEDVQEYIDTVRNRICEALPNDFNEKDLNIFPVSSLLALKGESQNNTQLIEDSGINEIRKQINTILFDGDIEHEKQEQYKRRLVNIVKAWESQVKNEMALYQTDLDSLNDELSNITVLQQNCDTRFELMEQYARNEQALFEKMLKKSIDKYADDLLEEVTYQVNHFNGKDFAGFVERDIPHIIKRQTEYWLSTHMNSLNISLDRLEIKMSEALSRYFNKSVRIASVMEEVRINPELELEGSDTKYASTKGGALMAGVAILGYALCGPIGMALSFIGMPLARESAQEKALNNAKAKLIPQLENVIDQYICDLETKVLSAIDGRFKEMIENVSFSYTRFVDEYKLNMTKCIEMKQRDESKASKKLEILKNNDVCIKQILSLMEEV